MEERELDVLIGKVKNLKSTMEKGSYSNWPDFLNKFNFFALQFSKIQESVLLSFKNTAAFPKTLTPEFKAAPERLPFIPDVFLRTKPPPEVDEEEAKLLQERDHPGTAQKNPKSELSRLKSRSDALDKDLQRLYESVLAMDAGQSKAPDSSDKSHLTPMKKLEDVLQSGVYGTDLPVITVSGPSVASQTSLPIEQPQPSLLGKRKPSLTDLQGQPPLKKLTGQD